MPDFRKYRKPAVDIKELKFQWNHKMKLLKRMGFQKRKKIVNIESQKLDDLDFLRKQPHLWSFYNIRSSYFFLGK